MVVVLKLIIIFKIHPHSVRIHTFYIGLSGTVCGERSFKVSLRRYGLAVNTPSSINPYNYLEIPESGGKAQFMINMAGVFDDRSFDQSLIDHYEFRASSLNYFWY